ncbi:MAG: replicative DNA helicase, partial [Candidatus Angelobacter sp.]
MATTDRILDRGMPASMDAERAILGAILLDNSSYPQAAEHLRAEDFSLDSHRRIYLRMMELAETGKPVDFVTLTEQLGQHKEIESVGGVAYVTSLTDGLPRVKNIEQYVKIVKDKALLRGLIHAATSAIQQAYEQEAPAEEIIDSAESAIFKVAEQRIGQGFMGIPEIVKLSNISIDKLYEQGQRITGLETHLHAFDTLTSGLQKSDLIIIAARPSMGKTALAVNIAENAAVLDKKVVGVFSLEMSRESLLLRMLCSQAMVDSHKMRTGFLSREDYSHLVTALGTLAEAPIFIDDTPGISISEMRA